MKVHFTTVVEGHDPDDGEIFMAMRHRVSAARIYPEAKALRFVDYAGETQAVWPVDLIDSVELPRRTPEETPAERVRRRHPHAGRRWTSAEEEQLAHGFEAGMSQAELAREHGRSPGGIRSRLIRLGLIDPDDPDDPGGPGEPGRPGADREEAD